MAETRLFPAPADGRRVESGVVQFGEDWPGYFMRGDDAMGLVLVIEMISKAGAQDPIALGQLEQYGQALRGVYPGIRDAERQPAPEKIYGVPVPPADQIPEFVVVVPEPPDAEAG